MRSRLVGIHVMIVSLMLLLVITPFMSFAQSATPGGNPTTPAPSGGTTPGGNPTTPVPGTDNATPDASSTQTVGFVNPIRFNSIPELIAGIINALLGILGAITVAILVMSGFKYMTSSNPGEVGQALDGIRNAIVGLMIIMGAFLITQYVISALASNTPTSTAPNPPSNSITPTPSTNPVGPGTTLPISPGTPTTPGSI